MYAALSTLCEIVQSVQPRAQEGQEKRMHSGVVCVLTVMRLSSPGWFFIFLNQANIAH